MLSVNYLGLCDVTLTSILHVTVCLSQVCIHVRSSSGDVKSPI